MTTNELIEGERAYRRLRGAIYGRCLKLLGDPAGAEDATHEVFERLLRHIGRLSPQNGYLGWTYRVSTNHCLNLLRDHARVELREPAALPERAAAAEHLTAAAVVTRLLGRFDVETRAVAVLALVEGMTQDEIAETLSVSRRTVGRRLAWFLAEARRHLGAAAHAIE